jgi:hypothetical protein
MISLMVGQDKMDKPAIKVTVVDTQDLAMTPLDLCPIWCLKIQ